MEKELITITDSIVLLISRLILDLKMTSGSLLHLKHGRQVPWGTSEVMHEPWVCRLLAG